MFVLFVLIATSPQEVQKTIITSYTAMSSLQRMVREYYLPLIKSFTVNNNYLPLIKIFTVNRIIYR